MKTSTKILLAGLVPVVLFAAANIAVNRARSERLAPEVEKLTAALDLKTIRVVDIRGPQAAGVQVFKSKGWTQIQSRSVLPSADWLRRSADTLIVDPPAPVHMTLPALEAVIRNGSAEKVEEYQP